MPSLARTESSSKSSKSSSTRDSPRASRSTRNRDSCESQSSNPTTIASSPRVSHLRTSKPAGNAGVEVLQHPPKPHHDEDLSPGTSVCARSSVETYASTNPSQETLPEEDDGVNMADCDSYRSLRQHQQHHEIPPLPEYRHEIVEPNVRPTTPNEFARLFPSMNRLSIRHDEFTSDGNMNLRVDTTVHSGRRRGAAQLFHLRMYDLARREFSLRRYCRDSGREVCNSKRKYAAVGSSSSARSRNAATGGASDSSCDCDSYSSTSTSAPAPAPAGRDGSRPYLPRSVSSAFRTLSSRPQSKRSQTVPAGNFKRPGTSGSFSSSTSDAELAAATAAAAPALLPTNTIKLEFSNYARVDVERRGKSAGDSKRYDFEWWGHRYSWRRTTDKHTGAVSFHLMRNTPVDGAGSGSSNNKRKSGDSKSITAAIAHIVPETRSPVQVDADEEAGGWVPPCHMWINDESVLDAMTDVADVIVATGLIALVDDCIKERWHTPKIHRIPVPLTSRTVDVEYVGPKAFMRQMFGRKNSGLSSSSRTDRHHANNHVDDYDCGLYHHHYSGPTGPRYPVTAY